jgi:Na+/proline symporter
MKPVSAYDYLERRFSRAIGLCGALFFIGTQMARGGVVLALPAMALAVVLGGDIYIWVLIVGVVALFYTSIGGISAVVWTDILQVCVLIGGACVAIIFCIMSIDDGPQVALQVAKSNGKLLLFEGGIDFAKPVGIVLLSGCVLQGLLPPTDQVVLQRWFSTSDEAEARTAIWTGYGLVFTLVLFYLLGTALWVYFESRPNLGASELRGDQILPHFLLTSMVGGARGVIVAGVFAAAMSTIDSTINSISAVYYSQVSRRTVERTSDSSARRGPIFGTVVIGSVLVLAAETVICLPIESMWEALLEVTSLSVGALSGVFGLGMFSRNGNSYGAGVGLASAVIVIAACKILGMVHFILWPVLGFCSCVIVGWIVSSVTPSGEFDVYGLTVFRSKE